MSDGTPVLERLARFVGHTPARQAALAMLSLVHRIARSPAGLYTLCYHHVAARHRANFERQLDYLARSGTFVDAHRALELLRSGDAAKGRYFLLSFDDGLADQIDVALPVLVERGIPALAFVVTAWLTDPPDRGAARADGHMARADVERWLATGMAVGSHTHFHRQLITLSDDELREELRRSSAVLKEISGEPPQHFACPWGVPQRDFRVQCTPDLVLSEGYASFFTTTRGVATGAADLRLMPRHVLEPHWRMFELDALVCRRPRFSGMEC